MCMYFLRKQQHKVKPYQNKPNQTNLLRSVSVYIFSLLYFSIEFGKKGKNIQNKVTSHPLSASLCGWQTTHIHILDENLSRCAKVLRREQNVHFLVWHTISTSSECVHVCVYVTFPNWPLWCHIHSKSIFCFTFFLVVNVKLSHFSYCSTHFQVILTMTQCQSIRLANNNWWSSHVIYCATIC